jgi:hypothetical protein
MWSLFGSSKVSKGNDNSREIPRRPEAIPQLKEPAETFVSYDSQCLNL